MYAVPIGTPIYYIDPNPAPTSENIIVIPQKASVGLEIFKKSIL